MRKLTFGLEEFNDVRAVNVHANSVDSVEFDIISKKSSFHVKLPAYGSHLASLAPAAVIVGQLLGLTDEDICKGFMSYAPVEGRSNVSNINGITLIDDCYNANPNSVKAALTSISALPGRHVAILGDMLNLGEHTVKMHHEVGEFAAQNEIDCLLCQGDLACHIFNGFISAGGSNASHYQNIAELMEEIPKQIIKGDAVLVKASRGMHFERLLPIISGSRHAQTKS
jgi:UDP-N-acetylmuramoyl-tripeptide--D-alanyl-D-alanine ligase